MESILERKLVSIGNYGNYSSDNYGSSRYVKIGGLTLYFSYKTVIAFEFNGATTVRENAWGPTTGKHLNAIDGGNKKERISGEKFEAQLTMILDTLGLGV